MKKLIIVSLIISQSCIAFAQDCCVKGRVNCHHSNTFEAPGGETSFVNQFPIIEAKIKQLYENEVFFTAKDPDFKIADICTADFLQRLENANDYDTNGYATWLLRSGMQDGDDTPSRIISIVPADDNMVIVHWSDMGHQGSTTFSMVESDGVWKIADATVPEGYNPL